MGVRITTWNVNGIRNPFAYQPWRDKRSFEGMFDILEADIVVFQETKIQRKDLQDDMVLVPGWDCYWSLPKHKKGYSGVVIYTRNSACAPIRAEEGVTGILTPPNTSTCFRDLPVEDQIGGYPNAEQLGQSEIDSATLDSEGRCVILEFPAFVLIGTYCPAQRDETRTEFRNGFLQVLDSRIRNLVAMGKRVIWTGDLNISREELDTAVADEMIRKQNVDRIEWISNPARRLFNQLLVGGKVYGEREEGRENPIMWDVCRGFHEGRKGMYTCWETKVNARPGNFGARIDYVVCSADMKDWWSDSNIQEGLMGSDHCPVYAVTKDQVEFDGNTHHISDIMNPKGMFKNGVRQQEWTAKNHLPTSGKLIPEFDRRRNIKDMFIRKPSLPIGTSTIGATDDASTTLAMPRPSNSMEIGPLTNILDDALAASVASPANDTSTEQSATPLPPALAKNSSSVKHLDEHLANPVAPSTNAVNSMGTKRQKAISSTPAAKRTKSATAASSKGQQSLKGFFVVKTAPGEEIDVPKGSTSPGYESTAAQSNSASSEGGAAAGDSQTSQSATLTPEWTMPSIEDEAVSFASRQTWGKLFARPIAPKCEHNEPCKTMQTKKAGVNCGRSFWMCNRPLGPTGAKERGTQWRCGTFIWTSDWDGHTGDVG